MTRTTLATCVLALLAGACSFDTEIDASAQIVIEEGVELVRLTVTGEPGTTLTIDGPGTDHASVEYACRYPYLSEGGPTSITCTYPIGEVPTRSLTYRVRASERVFMDMTAEAETLAHVDRELGLRWVQEDGVTLIDGTSGRLWIDGETLVLAGAPPGTSLGYGDVMGSLSRDGTVRLPIDLDQMANHVGVGALFDGSGAILQLARVQLGLPGEDAFEGTVTAPTASVRSALVAALSADETDRAPASVTGTALLVVAPNGRPALHGDARRVSDIAYIAVESNEERPRGRCGPYRSIFLGNAYGGSYLPRFSPAVHVEIHDRAAARVAARRTFRGERPSCPQYIENGTTRVVGTGPHPQDVEDWVTERVQRLAGTS